MAPQSIGSPLMWFGFLIFVVAMLAVDLGVFHRKAHVVGAREALAWSSVWIALALVFNMGVWQLYGAQRGMEFLTGYVIEKSLSLDNIFVFVVIFGALGIPALYQHRVLFWGILSALVLRAGMIFGGTALLRSMTMWRNVLIYADGRPETRAALAEGIRVAAPNRRQDGGRQPHERQLEP